MRFTVIGDPETVLGFRLAGVKGVAVSGRDETLEALRQALSTADIGVILITERLAQSIRDECDERLYGHGFPLLLEIPDPLGATPGRVSVEDVVRKAIGMSL